MAGPQHPFPPNFGGASQNDMRSQFGGPRSSQMAGISSPGQQAVAGIASPQTYNVGVNMQPQADSPISSQQLQQSAQQTSQQLQLQMQQRQQQPTQQSENAQQSQTGPIPTPQQQNVSQPQQNAQQSALAPHSSVPNAGGGANMNRITTADGSIQSQSAMQTGAAVASSGAAGPTPQQPPTTQQFNTASLCKLGQETVQDIVAKMQDTFQILRSIMPPGGTPGSANISNEKRLKLQEYLRNIRTLFKRLRVIYEKCNDNSQLQGMEYMHIESLIPLKEEWDVKTSEERKTSEPYRLASEECKELIDQVILKNSQLKEIIDHLRRIVWEINTMLTMRKS